MTGKDNKKFDPNLKRMMGGLDWMQMGNLQFGIICTKCLPFAPRFGT